MAYDDIQFYSSPNGGPRIAYASFDSGESFGKGDVVTLVAEDGDIQESLATGVTGPALYGVALAGPNGPGGITLNDPQTDTTYAAGALIPVAIPDSNTLWITRNFSAASSAFDDTAPLVADIGNAIGLVSIGGVWGVDLAPDTDDTVGRLIDILDNQKVSLLPRAGGTARTVATTDAFWVVFQIIAHMGTPDSGESVAPIGET